MFLRRSVLRSFLRVWIGVLKQKTQSLNAKLLLRNVSIRQSKIAAISCIFINWSSNVYGLRIGIITDGIYGKGKCNLTCRPSSFSKQNTSPSYVH